MLTDIQTEFYWKLKAFSNKYNKLISNTTKIYTRVSWLKKASNTPLAAEWKSTFSYTITTGLFGIRVSQGIWASALSFE